MPPHAGRLPCCASDSAMCGHRSSLRWCMRVFFKERCVCRDWLRWPERGAHMTPMSRKGWWGWWESNPHVLRHKFLRLARLPFRHIPSSKSVPRRRIRCQESSIHDCPLRLPSLGSSDCAVPAFGSCVAFSFAPTRLENRCFARHFG